MSIIEDPLEQLDNFDKAKLGNAVIQDITSNIGFHRVHRLSPHVAGENNGGERILGEDSGNCRPLLCIKILRKSPDDETM
jgi:hypothetical protein